MVQGPLGIPLGPEGRGPLVEPGDLHRRHTLRLDPRYDPIRHDPRFQALLVKYTHPGPAG